MRDYLLLAPLLLVILAAVPVVLAARRARRRHAVQDRCLAESGALPDMVEKVRVRLARPAWFAATDARTAAEGAGWLALDAQHLRVIGRFDDGSTVDREFVRSQAPPQWRGLAGAGHHGLHWFALGEPPLLLSADGLTDWHSARTTAALYRRVAAPGAPPPPRPVFHLQSHPLSLVTVLLLLALLAYAAYDGLLAPFALIGEHRWLTGVALACIPLGLLTYPLFRRARLQPRETLLLPLLIGFAVGLALIPLLARIDRESGDGEFAEAAYFFDGGNAFKPLQVGTPTISVANVDEYTAALKPGAEQGFYLRRGGLGLWQVETDSLRRTVLLWYQGQNKPPPRLRVH